MILPKNHMTILCQELLLNITLCGISRLQNESHHNGRNMGTAVEPSPDEASLKVYNTSSSQMHSSAKLLC